MTQPPTIKTCCLFQRSHHLSRVISIWHPMLVNSFLLTKRNGLVRCCSMGANSIGPSRMCAKIQPHVLSYGSLLVIHVTWPKPNQFSFLPKDQLAEYKISLNWISHNIIIIDVWVTNSVSSIPKFWYIPEQYNRYPKSTWMRTDCQYVLCRIVAMWDFQSPPSMQSAHYWTVVIGNPALH